MTVYFTATLAVAAALATAAFAPENHNSSRSNKTFNAPQAETSCVVSKGTGAVQNPTSSKPCPEPAAATNLNTSRSNIYRLDPANPESEKECVAKGGAVVTNEDQIKSCSIPAEAINLNTSRSN